MRQFGGRFRRHSVDAAQSVDVVVIVVVNVVIFVVVIFDVGVVGVVGVVEWREGDAASVVGEETMKRTDAFPADWNVLF